MTNSILDDLYDKIAVNLLIAGVLLFMSIFSSKISMRMGVPILIFFLLIGIGVHFLQELNVGHTHLPPEYAKFLGVITLTFILFSGGLDTDINHIRPILYSGMLLSTLGALITAVLIGVFLWGVTFWCGLGSMGFSLKQGILVGSIMASTDAATVFSILRSRKIHLKSNMGPLLELESGSNDVIVHFLMCLMLGLLGGGEHYLLNRWITNPYLFGVVDFVLKMSIGGFCGAIAGYGMVRVLNKVNLRHEGLYPALSIAIVFLVYGVTTLMQGSGYLGVYVAGIVLGNHDFLHRNSIVKFYEGFGWIMQISMFIALGMLVDLDRLVNIAPLGIVVSLVLMLLARPISVFLSLSRSRFNFKQKGFLSWVGLRGAVPIVFATYLYGEHGLPMGEGGETVDIVHDIFHLIVFVVIVSIMVQGSTLYPLAKWLQLNDTDVVKKKKKQVLDISENVKRMLIQLEVPFNSPSNEKKVVELGLPKEVLIVLIYRDNRYFTPGGNTVILERDKLFFVIDTKKELKETKACLGIL